MDQKAAPEAAKPEHPPEANGEQPKEDSEQLKEYGGPKGLEPTRYGDWERKGICTDF